MRTTIYNNYYLWDYAELAKENIRDNIGDDYEPSEEEIWDEIYDIDKDVWEDALWNMQNFFNKDGDKWLLVGVVELWRGIFHGGFIFETFEEMMNKATKDCEYFDFYDENGHFWLKCSHHDGTNLYEIKKLTDKGKQLLDNWAYGTTKRYDYSEQRLHEKLYNNYSVLPRFARNVCGG